MPRRLLTTATAGLVLSSLFSGAAPAVAADHHVRDLIAQVPVAAEVGSGYEPGLFPHWVDDDGDGCDTRSEVLQAESLSQVTFSSGCTVGSGQWSSRYDGAELTDASDVEIDHTVAPAEAWSSGADAWTPATRRAFANDLGYAGSLVAVGSGVRRTKGDQEPQDWLPPAGADAACRFLVDWTAVKWRWQLTMDAVEKSQISGWLDENCDDVVVDVDRAEVALAPVTPPPTLWPLVKIVYTSTIYELVSSGDGSVTPTPLSYDRWRDVYRFATFVTSPTDFVKYPWSPTVYAVTFWPGGEPRWQWAQVTYDEWRTAGYPVPRDAGWIRGSYYYKWGTSPELLVEGPDGVNHRLSPQEWRDSGYRPFVDRAGEGFMQLSWTGDVARMTDVRSGQGYKLGYAEWQAEGFPTPQVVNRIPGDQFYRYGGQQDVWYAGPTMNRVVTGTEWAAAGYPTPVLIGSDPAPAPGPQPPAPPVAVYYANCAAVRAAGKAPIYAGQPGYGRHLDGDGDGVGCE